MIHDTCMYIIIIFLFSNPCYLLLLAILLLLLLLFLFLSLFYGLLISIQLAAQLQYTFKYILCGYYVYISFNLLYLPGVPSALVYVNLNLNTFGTTLYIHVPPTLLFCTKVIRTQFFHVPHFDRPISTS